MRHILVFLLFSVYQLIVVGQNENGSQDSCAYIGKSYSTMPDSIDLHCKTIGILQISIWECHGEKVFYIPRSSSIRTIVIEGGTIMNDFLRLYGTVYDSISYHEINKKTDIKLQNIHVDYLEIFYENQHLLRRNKLQVLDSVSIKSMELRGSKYKYRTWKSLLRIEGLEKVTLSAPWLLSRKTLKKLWENNITVVID